MSINFPRAYVNKSITEQDYKLRRYKSVHGLYPEPGEFKEDQGYYWRRFKSWKHNRLIKYKIK